MLYILDADTLASNCKGRRQCFFSFGEKTNQLKPFKFQVKLLNHLQCRVNPCVYREEKGDNDNPYCY